MIRAHYLLKDGDKLDLDERALSENAPAALAIAQGDGRGVRGCTLNVLQPVTGIWIPLRGRLQIGVLSLHPGDLYVTEQEPGLQVTGRGRAVWVAVFGPTAAWREFVEEAEQEASPLLPAWHEADFGLRRLANTLRHRKESAGNSLDAAAEALIDRVVAEQEGFAMAIDACPGRTYRQRRQVFIRLQRIRNYIASNCQVELDNDALSRMAGYSPSHFIRIFHAAYGETPHVYLTLQRLKHASRLLVSSRLAISEIAMASGFDNPSTFSRVFREHFGRTARSVREAAWTRQRRPSSRAGALPSSKSAINRMSLAGL